MGAGSLTTVITQSGTTQYSFVVVSNRLPVAFCEDEAGNREPTLAPGGLVAAVAPAIAGNNAAWVGWDGTFDGPEEPLAIQGMTLFPISLSERLVHDHYEGFSNATLWPLMHDVGIDFEFEPAWWDAYRLVNEKFAEAIALTAGDNATVWIHDYQLMLAPSMLRSLRPDVTIGYFHHIPFPSPTQWALLPHGPEVLAGLAGADICGFQSDADTQNFLTVASKQSSEVGGSPVPVAKTYPISLDFAAVSSAASSGAVAAKAREFRATWGDPGTVFLGVDRIDYTKGIPERLEAFESLLNDGELLVEDVVFVQAGSPSRENVATYQALQVRIDAIVKRINTAHCTSSGKPAVVYGAKNLEREDMLALFVAADVMVVTPLRDGMNLVAKEFVAAKSDHTGVLVLSTRAGAADHLVQAVLVDPLDHGALSLALLTAINMDSAQAKERMVTMREYLSVHDVAAWASDILGDLASREAS